jgi:DNA polymerase III epsilon subunit-like protein
MNEQTKILFFDTETSDFIKKDLSADDPAQAWTVQIGAILATREGEIDKMNTIIKANGRTMNYYAQNVHGISPEMADEKGVEELEAAEQFGLLLRQAELVVCHNYAFDWKYVYQLMERNIDNLSDEARSAFYLDLPGYCTMKDKKIVTFCGLKNKAGRPKWPKLIELHEILFDETFDDAHDAFADISATAKCFFELVDRKLIVLEV